VTAVNHSDARRQVDDQFGGPLRGDGRLDRRTQLRDGGVIDVARELQPQHTVDRDERGDGQLGHASSGGFRR
jgi:hypothetical protein